MTPRDPNAAPESAEPPPAARLRTAISDALLSILVALILMLVASLASEAASEASAGGPEPTHVVVATTPSGAAEAVARVGGRRTHDLDAVRAVAARLSPEQVLRLDEMPGVRVDPGAGAASRDRSARAEPTPAANERPPATGGTDTTVAAAADGLAIAADAAGPAV